MRVGEVNRFYGKKVHFPDKNAGQEYRKNTVAAIIRFRPGRGGGGSATKMRKNAPLSLPPRAGILVVFFCHGSFMTTDMTYNQNTDMHNIVNIHRIAHGAAKLRKAIYALGRG